MRDHGRMLRQLDAAITAVDERLQVLEYVETVKVSRGEPVEGVRAEAARLQARRVGLLAKQRHYETHDPREPHPQDFPETPAPRFAYLGPDPTAWTAIGNVERSRGRGRRNK